MTEEVAAEEQLPVEPTDGEESTTGESEEQTPDNPDTGNEEEQATEPPQETEEHKTSKFQRRLDRQKQARIAAEAEARELRDKIAALEGKATETRQGEPSIDDFEDYAEYSKALARYEVKQTLDGIDREKSEAKQKEEARAKQQRWNDSVDAAIDEMPDFEEVVYDPSLIISPAMQDAIVESDIGPKIAYHLGNNPDIAKSILALSPTRQIAEIGKLEVKLTAKAPVTTSKAPEPIKPVGVNGKTIKAPQDMSQAEFEKWRQTTIKQRR